MKIIIKKGDCEIEIERKEDSYLDAAVKAVKEIVVEMIVLINETKDKPV